MNIRFFLSLLFSIFAIPLTKADGLPGGTLKTKEIIQAFNFHNKESELEFSTPVFTPMGKIEKYIKGNNILFITTLKDINDPENKLEIPIFENQRNIDRYTSLTFKRNNNGNIIYSAYITSISHEELAKLNLE